MNQTVDPPDRQSRIENFAADVTSRLYPLVLQHGAGQSWIKLEVGLWTALIETVRKLSVHRPTVESSNEFRAWLDSLLLALTDSALRTAVQNGVEGPALKIRLAAYRAIHLEVLKRRPVRESD